MSTHLEIKVPNAEQTAGWLREHNLKARGLQIEAAFSPEAGVLFVSIGERSSGAFELIEAKLTFSYGDFERAAAEFLAVGERLHFPPGTKLIHIVSDWDTHAHSFTQLATW